MTTVIPITLVGENLGQRHQYLNYLVNNTHRSGENFEIIKNLAEQSPIDRLFKIDLASKIRNVDYIIQNLKDDDILYVSRALKAKWLIDKQYEDIINPQYLEDRLYPEMITTAVNKMQHWTHLMLNDEIRCEQFYQHYKDKNFDLAVKFLTKCSNNYIQIEFINVVQKISPHYFKILCEKCSHIAKIFFDSLSKNDELKSQYVNNENEYFTTLRHLLKTDPELVLDITERYFNRHVFNRFSATQTKFIMVHHKNRFWQKPELYTGWLLNTQTVADSLGSEEAKKLVLKLAQAKYLTYLHWFNFKSVAPLIKRVNIDERAEFKKKIFVVKDIGEEVEEWPYETPEPPVREQENYYTSIFEDRQPQPYEYEHLNKSILTKRMIKKKKYSKYEHCDIIKLECNGNFKSKTLLDKLFDEFRFAGFEQTFYDLKKRIAAESSPQNREFMILVLVSKSGGRPEAIASLLKLLARHSNEPANVRAAIIRSLVKRAQVWRLPEDSWNQLLKFGQGLGLDGNTPVAECYEGLHAVVIRSLLVAGECQRSVQKAFLADFSNLITANYSLNSTEKKIIRELLPKMLLSIAKEETEIVDALDTIEKLIQTLDAYKIKVDTYPGLIDTIIGFAEKDLSPVSGLLISLFRSKIARKRLFRYTFDLIKTDASFVNALKHDTTVLNPKIFAKNYAERYFRTANIFFSKLSLYFNESNGQRSIYLNEFKTVDRGEHPKELAKPLAFLLGDQLDSYLRELDALGDKESTLLALAIRANAHVTRPALDINIFEWKKIGIKLVANKYIKCRAVEIDTHIEELLKSKRTAKFALALSKRTIRETEVFVKLATLRPSTAIKLGLRLIRIQGDNLDPVIWKTIKPLIQELDVTKPEKRYIVKSLADIKNIPLKIKPEYSTVIYTSFLKESLYKAMPPLCHIEILISDVDEEFLENVVQQFLNGDLLIPDKLSGISSDMKCTCLYIRVLVKFLFLCKSDKIQKRRLETFDLFLTKMDEIKKIPDNNIPFNRYLKEMLLTFIYNRVFLDTQYVSPLPVMEKAVVWLHKLFTIEEDFETFVHIHLLMLYCKSVRESVELAPEIFADKKRKRDEGMKVVGNLYGKYIARELRILSAKYFDSIIEMYSPHFMTYLEKFNRDTVSSDFLLPVIIGILEESKSSEYRLGIYLMENKHYRLTNEHLQELKKYLIGVKDEEIQWFAFALIYCNN